MALTVQNWLEIGDNLVNNELQTMNKDVLEPHFLEEHDKHNFNFF